MDRVSKAERELVRKMQRQTNADRIRSYTDQELAIFLGFVAQDAFCYGCGLRDKMILYQFDEYESTIEWLMEEAKVES